MLPPGLRQLRDEDLRRPLQPIGEATRRLRTLLENLGVAFDADLDPEAPGSNDVAALELSTGTQFAFEHHHAHPDSFVQIFSEVGAVAPSARMNELAAAVGLPGTEVLGTRPTW